MKTFKKRVFTPKSFASSLIKVSAYLPFLLRGLIKPTTSRALREKVMLSTTSVNDCRYCSWVHTQLAIQNGVDLEELNEMLGGVTGKLSDDKEAVAVIFAQHYAEALASPSKEAMTGLEQAFKANEKREVLAYIYAIYFANLSGNTFDALLARVNGQKVEGSRLWFEIVVSIISGPVLIPLMLVAKKDKQLKFEEL